MTAGAGNGSRRVLLHGWGLNGSVFADWLPALSGDCSAQCPDLPGSGVRRAQPVGGDVDALADAVLSLTPRPAHWIGWSLGGLVALAAARRAPEAVTRVSLIAASPCMVAREAWPGIDPLQLAAFRAELARTPAAAHERFLALQVRGSVVARPTLRALRRAHRASSLPDAANLLAGIDRLRDTDLRNELSGLACSVDAIVGACDQLLPVAVAEAMQALGVTVTVVPGAGHAPFLSHPDACAAAVMESP